MMDKTQPPICSAPDKNVEAPNFELPENACDCHFHIFDEPSQQVSPRTYTAPAAPLDDLTQLHSTLGFTRSVVVQPSIYGTDNRTTLSAATSSRTTKAIAVVEDTISMVGLNELKGAGVVGCRVNMLFQSNTSPVNLQKLARKVSEVDWHLQLLADVSTFDNLEKTVKSLAVPVVFDHMGHMPAHKGVDDPGFQQLLRLLDDGNVWGSDWPHPHVPHKMPNDTNLLNLLSKWVPDTQLRNRLLVDNPESLYGF